MTRAEAVEILVGDWDQAGQALLTNAVAILIEEKGGAAFLAAHPWFMDEPEQLAVHELEKTEVWAISWQGRTIKLRRTVATFLCEEGVPTVRRHSSGDQRGLH